MEIKIRRRKNNKEQKNNRPHLLIIFFLAAIFVLSSINVVRDLNSIKGLRPFGFLNEIFANGNLESLASGGYLGSYEKYKIKDNTDRCEAINPSTGKAYANSTGKSSSVTGKAGINQGGVGDGIDGNVNFIQGENNTGQDLGMGYILSIFTNPSDSGSAISFVKKANDSGLIPVVRLCYPGNCDFNLNDGSIQNFYRDINNQLTEGYEFVGLIGPNEPSTENEMSYFEVNNYNELYSAVNKVAQDLQGIRVVNGGKMYIAPVAFNLINTMGDIAIDDFRQFRNFNFNTDLIDYLVGNVYDSIDRGFNSYDIIVNSGLKEYAETKGLRIVLSEYGVFDVNPASLNLATSNFNKMCSDATIDGIVFFRSFEELSAPDPKPTQLSTEFISNLTQSCSRQRPWLNCNFDSAIYPDNPNKVNLVPESMAAANPSCIVRDPVSSNGAALLVSCNGNECSAKQVSTIRANLPIKQFGNNSSFGTKTRTFTPISAEIASYLGDSAYSPLNQFAGELKGGNLRYAMPMLGSAINNTSELSLYLADFASDTTLQSNPSPGSFSSNIKDEIRGDVSKGLNVSLGHNPYDTYLYIDGKISIPDERIVTVDGVNVEKDPESVKHLRIYNPEKTPTSFQQVPISCKGDLRYLQNSDDYITGPEVIVEEKNIWNGSGGELCRLYGERNNGAVKTNQLQTDSQLNCRVNPTRVIPITRNGAPTIARCSTNVACNFQNGYCNIDPQLSACIDYTPSPDDKVYMYSKEFPSIPSFQIKDIWDALYRQYQMLQNGLASRGLKIVFQENIGWKAEYQSMIRDGNKAVNDADESLYKSTPEELSYDQSGISGTAFEPNIFNNNYLPAKGQSTIKSDQYYDWLGYLDIIQEMRMVYLNNTELGDIKTTNEDLLPGRKEVILSGYASQFTSFPTISCDEIELCKASNPLCPFKDEEIIQKLKEGAKLNCITDIKDNRFEDRLQKALCGKGYNIFGVCVGTGMQCIRNETSIPGGTSTAEFNFNTNEEKLLFPVSKSREIPSCVEPSSVISVPVPASWNLKYFEENSNPINISNFKLIPEASTAFISMMTDMRRESPQAFAQCAVNWGYRSRAVQEEEVRQEGSCGRVTACACHSEHQMGTTLDFVANSHTFEGVGSFKNTNCFSWLNENAHNYGFVNSYGTSDPNNYAAEPWHWRWLPGDYAQEFYTQKSSYSGNLLNYLETKPSSGGGGSGISTAVTCPVANGKCAQGAGGIFSHSKLNAADIIGDSRQVIAPISGVVTRLVENYCINKTYDAGDGFILKGLLGGVEREIFFYHVDVRGAGIQVGQQFDVGDQMVRMADVGNITLSGNPLNSLDCKSFQPAGVNVHVHVEIVGAGASQNPETNVNNVLNAMGCNMHTGVTSCLPNASVDYGNDQLMCFNPDGGYVIGNKTYESFDDLVRAVAEYAADRFGTFYPSGVLRATVEIETSSSTENGTPYGGDPTLIAHQNENSAGASGPTQFLPGVFMGIVQSNQAELQSCIEHIGLNIPTISPESRNVLGVALCATAIKHNTNMLYFLPSGAFGTTITSSEDWYERSFAPNTGRANWGAIFQDQDLSRADGDRYDFRTQNISAVEVTGRRYYGACYPSLAAQESGDGYNYCTALYDLAKSFN